MVGYFQLNMTKYNLILSLEELAPAPLILTVPVPDLNMIPIETYTVRS
jgi:hypothetical protein